MYQRYVAVNPPAVKPETLLIIGGSVALIAAVLYIKKRKRK